MFYYSKEVIKSVHDNLKFSPKKKNLQYITLRYINVESKREHLFIKKTFFYNFGEIFRLPYHFSSINQAVTIWMSVGNQSQYGVCSRSVAAYILREIWVSRCRATFDGDPMHARSICVTIMKKVRLINLLLVPKSQSLPIQENILAIIGISRPRADRNVGFGVNGSDRHQIGLRWILMAWLDKGAAPEEVYCGIVEVT